MSSIGCYITVISHLRYITRGKMDITGGRIDIAVGRMDIAGAI
jgi:hypothetical protein